MNFEGGISFNQLVMNAIENGENPRIFIENYLHIHPDELLGKDSTDFQAWNLLLQMASILQHKSRLRPKEYISNMDNILKLFSTAQKIVVIIGAGASIGPDFRSPGGLYSQIQNDGVLEDPCQVFDESYFRQDPSIFWKYAHLIFPSLHPKHSSTHYLLAALAEQGRLLRLYTQNVDVLEIGIPDEKLQCVHGSWRQSKCLACERTFTIEEIRPYVESQTVPVCPCGGQIKPGIVFFGQDININETIIDYDAHNADLLVVIGTSLRVAPVSYLPEIMDTVPSILINREPVTCEFNAELLGDCSQVVQFLAKKLNINLNPNDQGDDLNDAEFENVRYIDPNKFIFPSQDGTGTQFLEDGRSLFLVTPSLEGKEPLFN